MPNPRTPVAKARATGAAMRNPARHRGRSDPSAAFIGPPPSHLSKDGKIAWALFVNELPWLTAADGALLAIAAMIRGELISTREVGLTALRLYQTVLGKLGATPSDRSKVAVPDGENDEDDFFGPN